MITTLALDFMTMDEPMTALADDLDQKFKELCSIHDVPKLYVSEYFSELRNRIDIDTEQKLMELSDIDSTEADPESSEEAASLTELRNTFICILKNMEDDLLKQLPVDRHSTSEQVYEALSQRIDEFRESMDNNRNIKELEDTYISLANELFDQSSQLEAQNFRDQTIVYLNSERKPGQLFYVEFGHLNKAEVEALR